MQANKRHYDVTQKEIIAGIVAEVSHLVCCILEKAGVFAQALPIHPNAGWALEGGKDGLRIFSKHLNSLQHYSSTQVVAASLIVDVSAKVSYISASLLLCYLIMTLAGIVTDHLTEGVAMLVLWPTLLCLITSFSRETSLHKFPHPTVHHEKPSPWTPCRNCVGCSLQSSKLDQQICTCFRRICVCPSED